MARDMEMDMLIKPIVDTKAFDAGLKKLQSMAQKGVSGLSGQQTIRFESLASRLISSLVVSGRATTATQGRMQVQSALGRISGETASILRGAQNIAEIAVRQGRVLHGSFSERQIARFRPDLAGAATAYNNMVTSYSAFKGTPTEQGKNELLKAVQDMRTYLSNISKDRKVNLKTISKIEKDTNAIGKEAFNWKTPFSLSRTTTAVGMLDIFKTGGKWLLGILGIGSVIGAVKKWVDFGISGTKEGSAALLEQAMYGSNRNIAIGRARAKMYGLDESVTSAPERYALDFRQRMMYGEVSDKEWIALSRMGGLGRMIISGQAAQNPKAFQQALQNYITANRGNEAEVRQTLSWLGLSPQLMKYGAIKYSENEEQRLESAYGEAIKAEKDAAVLVWKTADEFDKFIQELRATSAKMLAAFTNSPESRMRLGRSWFLSGYSDIERGIARLSAEELAYKRANPTYWNTRPYFSDFIYGTAQDWIQGNLGIKKMAAEDVAFPEITNYNTFYINGGNTNEVTDAVKRGIYYNNNSGGAQ